VTLQGGTDEFDGVTADLGGKRALAALVVCPLEGLRPERSVAGLAGDFVCGGALA
jgi:hypothetical protein